MVQPKKFHIRTFGCQMNVADTEHMGALMQDAGYQSTENPADADLILINGCSVREKAVHKAVSALGRYQKLINRESGRRPILGLGGCVGQLDKGKVFNNAPYLDFVFGPDAIDELPEIVHRVTEGERHSVYTDFDRSQKYSTETKVMSMKSQAFVNIMKGCDKYCTYCIVPFTRGREKSRTIDEVLDDVARLVAQGVREVTLLGQNVNSFGKGNPNTQQREPRELNSPIGKVGPRDGEENFPQLLRAIDADPRCQDLKYIRFTSSHPVDFSDELLDCYALASAGGVKRLAPHLHLPVQSGSNAVLQKMGRHHKIETYFEQMERLLQMRPDVGISTDLIVGFPGETEEDFQLTLRLLDRMRFDNIYAFAYSVRPGTRAAKWVDDVPNDVKNRRLTELLDYQLVIAKSKYSERLGKTMEVLVEGEARNQERHYGRDLLPHEKVWTAKSGCNRVVNFVANSARDFTGRWVEVKIIGATSLSLQAELPTDAEKRMQADLQTARPSGLTLDLKEVSDSPLEEMVL